MSFNLRLLRTADIPAAMALVRQVGWNQTAADWMRFLRAQPDGCFAASVGSQLVGTVTTIVYEGTFAKVAAEAVEATSARGRLAWIGMLIVDADHRGQGLGRRLLVRALEFLDPLRISCVKLDATPDGRALYEKQGFVVEQPLERWELARPSPSPATTTPGQVAPPIEDIIVLDRQLFGADRGDLLRSIAAEAPNLTVVLREDKDVIGYACGRRGTRADHLGPWMARDARAGEEVLRTFLERSDRPLVYVDCLTNNPWSSHLAEASGFRLARPLTRMCRGVDLYPGETNLLGAIVGPEFG